MIQATLTWNGPQVIANLQAGSYQSLLRAAAFFHAQVLNALNASYPPASLPYNPPHKRTGFLQRNVTLLADPSEHKVRVGVRRNALYGAFLEFGTKKMLPRPFLLATLKKFLPQMRAIAMR